MKKKLLSLVLALSLCFALGTAAFAGGKYVLDMDNVVGDQEPLELIAQEIFDRYGVAVVYASIKSLEGMTGAEYAHSLYSQNISSPDGILLLDCREASSYFMHYAGAAQQLFAQGDGNAMMTAYDQCATYDEAVRSYLNAADEILSQSVGIRRDLVLLEDVPELEPVQAGTETVEIQQSQSASEAPLLSLTEDAPQSAQISQSQQTQQAATQTAIPEQRQLPLVVDTAGVLIPSSAQYLNRIAQQISDKYKCDVAAVFVNTTGSKSAQAFADDFYDYNGYGHGSDDSGIIFMVAVQDRTFAISTYGSASYTFTDYGQQYMDDCYITHLKNNDWAGAAEAYLLASEELLNYEVKNGRPYDISYENEKDSSFGGILISLLAGFVLSFIPVNSMQRKMRTVQKQVDATDYVRRGSFDLYRKNDRFITSQVTRAPFPKNTNNNRSGGPGGGSSFHVSSSGRTHGGHSGRF